MILRILRDSIVCLFIVYIVLMLFILAGECFALEKDYAVKWCDAHNGKSEVVLADGARADCVTATYAVEVQPAESWAEAIGQTLLYAIELKKKPAVVLIADKDRDYRFIGRLNRVARKYNIKVFIMEE